MNERCFAYRSEKKTDGGFEWKREYCDALSDVICGHCPFFKDKDSVKMVIVNKMVQYEDLK